MPPSRQVLLFRSGSLGLKKSVDDTDGISAGPRRGPTLVRAIPNLLEADNGRSGLELIAEKPVAAALHQVS
jgi:hypothetical protein